MEFADFHLEVREHLQAAIQPGYMDSVYRRAWLEEAVGTQVGTP
jgi:hypothetical protein